MPIAERAPARSNTNLSKYYVPNGELARTQDVELEQIWGNKEGKRAQELGESSSTVNPNAGESVLHFYSAFRVLDYDVCAPVQHNS